jgi:hypothetical protein
MIQSYFLMLDEKSVLDETIVQAAVHQKAIIGGVRPVDLPVQRAVFSPKDETAGIPERRRVGSRVCCHSPVDEPRTRHERSIPRFVGSRWLLGTLVTKETRQRPKNGAAQDDPTSKDHGDDRL